MLKKCIFFLGVMVFVFSPFQYVKAETSPKKDDWYVTTEDVILDIIFPTIDQRVTKEYGGNNQMVDWQFRRIVGLHYNDNHSYDVTVRIGVPSESDEDVKEDLVEVRVSPSCDSDKLNKQKCNHDFKIEIVDYQHESN
jgi:hypothetical protein